MGNANGREEGSTNMNINSVEVGRIVSSESMGNNSPPESPGLSRSPLMFAPQLMDKKNLETDKYLLEFDDLSM
ncbi:SNF1-related protein kinase regulatory subunit beta-2 [Bienertia sinuspersici]